MGRPRLIPVLLLSGGGLVKSVKFKGHKYIGDPLNAARIFNELEADELIFLDIQASREGRCISLDFVNELAEELTMPFSVGGGITSLEQIRSIIRAGVEKVVIGTYAIEPDFVRHAAAEFGSSTISVCVDAKRSFWGRDRVHVKNGKVATPHDPVAFAKSMEEAGAGELIIQSIDRDGTMNGYDVDLINSISTQVRVPVVALGGAGSMFDLMDGIQKGMASAVAAGSLFVYNNADRGVLINYPSDKRFLENNA